MPPNNNTQRNNRNKNNNRGRSRNRRNVPRDMEWKEEEIDIAHPLAQLCELDKDGLLALAEKLELTVGPYDSKRDIVINLLKHQAEEKEASYIEGVLEVLPDHYGFLRSAKTNYLPGQDDVYVSPTQIRKLGLHTGDTLCGFIRKPNETDRYQALVKIDEVNYRAIDLKKRRVRFDKITPLYPSEKFDFEGPGANLSTRILDLVAPIGKGQRGLIVKSATYR